MQKLILLLFASMITMGLAATNNGTADMVEPAQKYSAMKVATIREMYHQDASNQGQDYPVTLEQYGSRELQAAMQLEKDYFKREQMSCHIGYDVLWDSQDSDYEQDTQFSMTEQGLVKVSLEYGSEVYYKLSCNYFNCQVTDVILDNEGNSLQEYLLEACS